jgi:hypothetical protein
VSGRDCLDTTDPSYYFAPGAVPDTSPANISPVNPLLSANLPLSEICDLVPTINTVELEDWPKGDTNSFGYTNLFPSPWLSHVEALDGSTSLETGAYSQGQTFTPDMYIQA